MDLKEALEVVITAGRDHADYCLDQGGVESELTLALDVVEDWYMDNLGEKRIG